MTDDKQPGCTLTIHWLGFCNSKDLKHIAQWLLNAGISEEYKEKILAIKHDLESKNFTIRFDSAANCFEAMQKITNRQYQFHCFDARGMEYSGQIKARRMSCPCGRIVKVTILANLDHLELRSIIEEYENYGQILIAERVKIEGFRTGDIALVMFVKPDSILHDNKWEELKEDTIKVEQYFPDKNGKRISKEVIDELWNKHGYFSTSPDVDKLAICEKEQAKNIEQLD